MVMRDGQMMSLKDQPSVLNDNEESSLPLVEDAPATADVDGEKMLIPC